MEANSNSAAVGKFYSLLRLPEESFKTQKIFFAISDISYYMFYKNFSVFMRAGIAETANTQNFRFKHALA